MLEAFSSYAALMDAGNRQSYPLADWHPPGPPSLAFPSPSSSPAKGRADVECVKSDSLSRLVWSCLDCAMLKSWIH